MALLTPTFMLTSIFAIDAEGLRRFGYRALVLDVDNTMLPRDTDVIPPGVREWADGLHDEGFELIILSNSFGNRAKNVAAVFGLPYMDNAWKPLPHGYIKTQHRLAAARRETLMVGDQLFTDVLGGKLWHYDVAKVVPLVEYDLRHTVFLRKFERPLMGDLIPTDTMVPLRTPRPLR